MKLNYIPNCITSIRFLLVVPLIVALSHKHYEIAFFICVAAGLSDAVDGFLARWFNWTSRWGAMLDPLSDKVLLMSAFITLGWLQEIPLWIVILVVFRDVWIMMGGIAYRLSVGEIDYKPTWISKINTFLQIMLVGLILFNLSFGWINVYVIQTVMYAMLITCVLSMFHYTWVWALKGLRYYNFFRKPSVTLSSKS